MRSIVFGWLMAGMVTATMASTPDPVEGQVSAGVVLDRDGLRHFHLALGHVYGVPVQSVSSWHPSWLHHDELPVIYLLAREARVSPEVVIALRQHGWSWIEITDHLRVDPYIFVSHLPSYSYQAPRYNVPRGYAYGYWKKPSRSQLRRLSDRHIIDYVNVYFWSTAHRRPVREVIVIRERAPTWTHYVRAEAPRVRFQEPARAQPVTVQRPPATRPAQPRATTQGPAAGNRAPASSTRAPSPTASRAPSEAANRTPNPAANRAPNPAANRAPNPAANRAPAPAASRGTAPNRAADRAPSPAANRAPNPAANRAPTPAASRAPAPAASRSPAPAASRSPAPSRAPAASRAPAPAANRTPPAASRGSSPPAASRPPAQRGGGAARPASSGRGGG